MIGEYKDTTLRLYPKEQLWLAYPAESGKTWRFKSDPLGDSSLVARMELVSTNATSYSLESTAMAGLSFFDSCYCYCYKQTRADSVSYYYYNKEIGAVAYQRYVAGKLFDTYILKASIILGHLTAE